MNLALLVIGAVLALVPTVMALWPLTPASTVARVSRSSYRAAGASILSATILTALPTLLGWVGLTAAGALCERVFSHELLFGDGVGVAATGLLILMLIMRSTTRRNALRATEELRVESSVGRHGRIGHLSVVVLSTDDPVAYSVDGGEAQIVLSSGLLRGLTPVGRRVVISHELAHLELGHDRHLMSMAVVEVLARWLVVLRPGVEAWRLALERWADSEVHRAGFSISDIWSAVLVASQPPPGPVCAFAAKPMLDRRYRALVHLDHAVGSRQRVVWWAAMGAPALLGALAAGRWLVHTHEFLAAGIGCPF